MQQAPDPGAASFDDTGAVPGAADGDDTLYAPADTPITPQIKDQIASEVQRQIAFESAVVSGSAQPSAGEFPLSLTANRLFVVADILDVATPGQQACSLTPGDVLRLEAAPPGGSGTADLRVASSHRQDCPAGTMVTVSLVDLQEMQNSLRAQLDGGLQTLRADQGQGGLPAAPPSALGAVQPSSVGQPAADPSVATLLDAQQQDATRTESAAVQSLFPAN